MKVLLTSLATRLAAAFSILFFALSLTAGTGLVNAQAINEDFATVASNTAAPLPNWVAVNNSTSIGTTGWFQGSSATFTSQAGAPTAYIAANYNSTTNSDDISNWLISPNLTFKNGDVISFYTRTVSAPAFPDRLQVRLSTNGASTNVGSGPTGIGDFTNLLLDINPTLTASGYPNVWTQYTLTLTGLSGPTSGRFAFRYYVTNGGPSGANSDYIGIDTLVYTPAVTLQHVVDFNGDGKTDYAVVRNTGGGPSGQMTWFTCLNGTAEPGCAQYTAWGIASDKFVPADYDGDGKTDIAVWRSAAAGVAGFYILQSATNTVRYDSFGQAGDDPTVTADYTGDGKADPAVYRPGASPSLPSYWYYRASSGTFSGSIVYEQWGLNGDTPAPGDYDGDGKADFMVRRDGGSGQGIFWLRTNTTNIVSNFVFGAPADTIVPGDYDGDGKTDIATVRGIGGAWNWFYRASSTGNLVWIGPFGNSATDFPVQGDYDGDGKTDPAVWRPAADSSANYFHALGSTSGYKFFEWGQNGDYPVANYNAH
jgi:hypothetical protein